MCPCNYPPTINDEGSLNTLHRTFNKFSGISPPRSPSFPSFCGPGILPQRGYGKPSVTGGSCGSLWSGTSHLKVLHSYHHHVRSCSPPDSSPTSPLPSPVQTTFRSSGEITSSPKRPSRIPYYFGFSRFPEKRYPRSLEKIRPLTFLGLPGNPSK